MAVEPKEDLRKYLDLRTLNRITRLELKARHIVEGFIAGMHKSPYKGFSVEFAEHREYSPGDDLRHLDWKVFGRSDRLYIKEYELETNLRAHILLDTSESMSYASGGLSKLELGCFIAASVAYLVLRQQDACAVVTFDKDVRHQIPPANSLGHLRSVLRLLVGSTAVERTDLGTVLHRMAERIRQKGLVILISDLFDRPESILRGLEHLRHRRHDVIVFHVMDEDELSFPFQRLTRFIGMESLPTVQCDPRAIRQAYLDEVSQFCKRIAAGSLTMMVDYVRISTDQQLDTRLAGYLAQRLGTRWKRR